MYSALAVANHFLDLAEKDGKTLTPMKLQKLVFLAHGWYLGVTGSPLIGERVEAWKWGPVIRELYYETRRFKGEAIRGKIERISWENPWDGGDIYKIPESEKEIGDFLKMIWDTHKDYSAITLSNWLHRNGSPWDQVWNDGKEISPKWIPDEIIMEYYKKLVDEEWARREKEYG